MQLLDTEQLALAIKEAFLQQKNFMFDKHIPTFTQEGKFFGDYVNFISVEPQGNKPPIFYHTLSPFDVVSHKAPQQALVFQAGELLLNTEFTDYALQRTGIMDAVLLQALGVTSLRDKKVLFIGTGKTGTYSMRACKTLFPDFENADFLNTRGEAEAFISVGETLGLQLQQGNIDEIGTYDYIFCHTNSTTLVLTADMKRLIKKGAVITSFTSENFVELADEYFESKDANIIITWNFTSSQDLNRSVEKKLTDPEKIIHLKELLEGKAQLNPEAAFTVYRSDGTPIQNLAVLKLLLKK